MFHFSCDTRHVSAWLRLTIQHDTIEEFNVDSKVEWWSAYLAHVGRNIKYKKKLKQTNAIVHLVRYT